MSTFGDWMLDGGGRDIDSNIRCALSEVSDTAYACKLWFESYGVPFTGSDVIAMTRLVTARAVAYDSEAN
jgi:hypothetical protein